MTPSDVFAGALHLTNQQLVQELILASASLHLEPGDFLIREGDKPIFVPFLLQGIVRGFLFDINGREITDCFAIQPGIPVMTAADFRMPSPLYLEAAVPCDFLTVPVTEIQRLLGQYSELQSLYNQLLVDSFSMHWEIKLTLCRNTAMQKYQWFLKKAMSQQTVDK